jgi:hypothetical protein
MNDPKRPSDPSGEVTPQRKPNDSGGEKTVKEHLIHREGESDPRIVERRPDSDARETSDGSLRRDEEKGYRNSDEV